MFNAASKRASLEAWISKNEIGAWVAAIVACFAGVVMLLAVVAILLGPVQ